MPLPDKMKSTVWSAVYHIERTMDIHYPKSFPIVEDAKSHIDTICAEENYHYHLRENYNLRSNDPHHVVRMVKDRVCFLVAVRAHGQGEFYLEEPLPDRKSLRDAVEADISRAILLITKWPTEFFDADVAAKYVVGVCALNKFEYTPFEGVAAEKFQGYVTFNTARHAFAAGMFELKVERKNWTRIEKREIQAKKQAPLQKQDEMRQGLKTLNGLYLQSLPIVHMLTLLQDAVEFDVRRVLNLIPSSFWPSTFSHINEARNFVGRYCYETRFRYMGWPDVALYRYQLFVNYNAAKYALGDGVFKVEQKVPEKKSVPCKDVNKFDDDFELTSNTPMPLPEASNPPATAGTTAKEVEKHTTDPKEAITVDPFKVSTLLLCVNFRASIDRECRT
ncbi:hypothetical protein N0V95_005148 [Ascochyta clinopodiicola]|nr:hypothetical protein N0V95_005148 [Ascochyta clinopodiicola]